MQHALTWHALIQRSRTRGRSYLAAVVVVGLALAGCSGSESNDAAASTFCVQAEQYLFFTDGLVASVDVPESLDTFMQGWSFRLDQLRDVAPEAVADDLDQLTASVDAATETLNAVGYDVLSLTLEDLDTLETIAADAEFSEYLGLNCGIGPDAPDPDAPAVLSGDEVENLESEAPGLDEFETLLAQRLSDELGLSSADASCLVSTIGADNLLDDPAGEQLLAGAETCGISEEQLVGG